ncbi:MAG: hypothetical protein KF764_31505 [Labilithrix sp.]|nr:hypothetical protein [Labilithrix sp.]
MKSKDKVAIGIQFPGSLIAELDKLVGPLSAKLGVPLCRNEVIRYCLKRMVPVLRTETEATEV